MVQKMKAFVTSIGEPSTSLCVWALERNGFDVTLLESTTTLADKLIDIYTMAETTFLRVDADVIVNKNCTPDKIQWILEEPALEDAWWVQFQIYDWYQQDIGYGGIQLIKEEALILLRRNAPSFKREDRPETALSRAYGMYNPRRFESFDRVMGIHNYKNEIKRVARVKANRGQSANYDFELAQRMEEL